MKLSSMQQPEAAELGLVQRLKNRLLPHGSTVRRLPLGPARGCRMTIDFAHDTRLFLGLYERELNSWIRQFCPPGSRCFDIGADRGYDSLLMACLGGSQITAFECNPKAAEAAQRNFDANRELPASITLVQAFVSDSSVGDRVAIDDYIKSQGSVVPDFVKIDIEGAEFKALKGMSNTLNGRHPHVIVETHSRDIEEQCAVLLKSHGYDPHVVNARRWLADKRPIEHNRWLVSSGVDGN